MVKITPNPPEKTSTPANQLFTLLPDIDTETLLIQLFFVYFALPALGIKVSGFTAAIITTPSDQLPYSM